MEYPQSFWDERYAVEEYIFGESPNDFLVECVSTIPAGVAFGLGEGEGRNGVWLAARGFTVRGIDLSPLGIAKAQRLAARSGVTLDLVAGDLATLELEPGSYDLIYSVFAHTPPQVRAHAHRQAVAALRPGGHFVLEAYQPAQLGRGTGGPQDPELLVPLAAVQEELDGLEMLIGREIERAVLEGDRHTGVAAVTQVFARKVG
ncbi:MAG: class I SAM-dependent methyltransferase [Acidimicrobiia bacterium]